MFDFYSQSGEFLAEPDGTLEFLKDFAVQAGGTALGAWAALALYKRQTKDARETESHKQKQQDIDTLLFFDHLVESSIELSDHVNDGMEKMIKNLNTNPYYIDNFAIASKEDLRRLVFDLKRDDLFYAYRRHVKGNDIQILFNCIDTIHSVMDNIIADWKNVSTKQAELKSSITGIVNRLLNEFVKISDGNDDDIFISRGIDSVINDYFSNNNEERLDFTKLENSLFKEINDIITANHSRSRPKWELIRELAVEGLRTISTLGFQGSTFNKNLKHSLLVLKEALATLKVRYDPLKGFLRQPK